MKFLKQIFQTIKNIFIRKSVNLVEPTINSELEVQINENEVYSKIKIGDIIWAKRYANETEKENIREGHREGPFIVLTLQDGNLFCAQGSSLPPYENYSNVYFCIDSLEYDLKKITYFNLIKLIQIDEFSFIRKIDELKENDLNDLYRHIKKNHKTYYDDESKMIKFKMPILVGDIISVKDKNYIIIDKDKNKFVCLCLNNKINFKRSSQLNINSFNDLDYSNIITIDDNENIKYINSVCDNILKYILKQQKEELINNKNQCITQRGSIVLKDDKHYYIYGEESCYWLVFEISKECMKGFDEIEIGDSKYFTKYEESKINKKDEYTNIFTCSEIDKDRIKHLRKSYKEVKKNESIYGTSEFVYFTPGSVIENINYKNKRYLVIKLHKKTYECLNVDDIKNGLYNPVLIKKTDAKCAKNNSLEGIKWFESHKNFNLKGVQNEDILNEIFKTQKEFLGNKQINGKLENISQFLDIQQSNNDIKINTVIKKDGFSEETFIVKDVLGDMLVCISSIESGIKNPRKYYFNKNNVIFVQNKQKRK